jgi:hypothetical protein
LGDRFRRGNRRNPGGGRRFGPLFPGRGFRSGKGRDIFRFRGSVPDKGNGRFPQNNNHVKSLRNIPAFPGNIRRGFGNRFRESDFAGGGGRPHGQSRIGRRIPPGVVKDFREAFRGRFFGSGSAGVQEERPGKNKRGGKGEKAGMSVLFFHIF